MALTDVDADLLKRCLSKQPGSWNDFVDRYLSLIYHAIHFSAHLLTRETKSVPPPGGKGISKRIGLDGNSCVCASADAGSSAQRSIAPTVTRRMAPRAGFIDIVMLISG